MMFLFGIMSAVCTGSPRWWFYAGSWVAGCYVLGASSVCFRSLYKFFGQSDVGAGGRNLVCVLSFAYICGWSIFPIVWTVGHSGTGDLSDDALVPLAGLLLQAAAEKRGAQLRPDVRQGGPALAVFPAGDLLHVASIRGASQIDSQPHGRHS